MHCVTRKGFGYAAAEADEADRMHTIGPAVRGLRRTRRADRWTDVFVRAEMLVRISAQRCVGRRDVWSPSAPRCSARPGCRRSPTRFPDRVFDVGIAEQHAVTSAAGLAMGGLHPVVCVYATFLNRAFDQVLMDVALHRLPVTFVLDRAGITGTDGPSHHGMWDLSLLGTVPGMRVAAPRDAAAARAAREAVADADGPTALRFPKADVAADLPALGRLGRTTSCSLAKVPRCCLWESAR